MIKGRQWVGPAAFFLGPLAYWAGFRAPSSNVYFDFREVNY